MISRHMATAMAVIAVSGESSRRTNSLALPSFSKDPCLDSLLLYALPLPTTVRRLPPVEVALHSPENSFHFNYIRSCSSYKLFAYRFRHRNCSTPLKKSFRPTFDSDNRTHTGCSAGPDEAAAHNPCTRTGRVRSRSGTNRGTFCMLPTSYRNIVSSGTPCTDRHRASSVADTTCTPMVQHLEKQNIGETH